MSAPTTVNATCLGQHRALNVVVDSANAVVTQFQFAELAYFLHSPSTPQGTWRMLCGKPVQSIWVYALPSVDWKPNPWKICLEFDGGKMITLELYDTKTGSGTVVLVRSLTEDADANPKDDFDEFSKIKVTCAGRPTKDNVTLRDIILKIQAADLLTYQLSKGRGYRFWVTAVLYEVKAFVREPPRCPCLRDEANNIMRSLWTKEGQRSGRFGYEDEPNNPMNIKPGVWRQVYVEGEEM
ncbi:hypothetical protein F5Y13DRAFT_184233 [Hypoxylon sp. FL1857]|nr:hypothetical protein F5Y13DRAFT_184233 [Hypoxylon sp. FL1857]